MTSERRLTSFENSALSWKGGATIEGEWAGLVTGLGDQHVEIAMMRTPDGHSRLELSCFLRPAIIADHRNAPVNALGYLRGGRSRTIRLAGFASSAHSLVGDMVQYQNSYRLCYIRT
jgi:hypothetical protein